MRAPEPMVCIGCGYSLQGLPARKCGGCSQVYVRCPECGAAYVGNETHGLLLQRWRKRVERAPRVIQTLQISLLVFLGVGWSVAGFVMGSQPPQAIAKTGMGPGIALALVVGVLVAITRLLVFQQHGTVPSCILSAGLVVAAWLFGTGFGQSELANGQRAFPVVVFILMVAGAVIGAASARWIGVAGLWLFAKDADRRLLQERWATPAAKGPVGGGLEANWYLRFCEHCAAELPALAPADCPECGLLRVECPACGNQCGVSPSRAVLVRLGQLGRMVRAGVLIMTRFVVLAAVWPCAFGVGNQTVYGWAGPAGPVLWGLYLPRDPGAILALLFLIGIARAFIFAGRGMVSGSLLVTLVIGSAGWAALEAGGGSPFGPGFVQFALVTALAASLVISAGWWCLLRVLPRRKVAMFEDAFTPSRDSLAAGARNAE